MSCGEEESLWPLPEKELRFHSHRACSQSLYLVSYTDLVYKHLCNGSSVCNE